jgi:hypothetical protein
MADSQLAVDGGPVGAGLARKRTGTEGKAARGKRFVEHHLMRRDENPEKRGDWRWLHYINHFSYNFLKNIQPQ